MPTRAPSTGKRRRASAQAQGVRVDLEAALIRGTELIEAVAAAVDGFAGEREILRLECYADRALRPLQELREDPARDGGLVRQIGIVHELVAESDAPADRGVVRPPRQLDEAPALVSFAVRPP